MGRYLVERILKNDCRTLQTIEHTKCKPVSVTMAMSLGDRRILVFQVSKMPAAGDLATISRKEYVQRPD